MNLTHTEAGIQLSGAAVRLLCMAGELAWNLSLLRFITEKVKEVQGPGQRSHLSFPLFYLIIFLDTSWDVSQLSFSLYIEYFFFAII